jgi:hypothetical protein
MESIAGPMGLVVQQDVELGDTAEEEEEEEDPVSER